MQTNSDSSNPLQLDDFLPRLIGNPVGRSVKTAIEKTLGLSYLAKNYRQLEPSSEPAQFVTNAFNLLDIDYRIISGEVAEIPSTGPVIVVANHPYGAVDGMAMIKLLSQRRKDIKVMANGLLKRIPEISDIVLSVNPYRHKQATKANMSAMRECLRWLQQGGLVFMFPAGDVSDIQLKKLSISDNEWDNKVARLALKTAATVVPVHIEGRNSAAFYLASAIHPGLKTLMLPRQIINKRGSTMNIRIGQAVTARKLQKLELHEIVSVLKLKTYLLTEQTYPAQMTSATDTNAEPIAPPIPVHLLSAEINAIRSQCLAESGDMQVYYARASQIPFVLREIGRLRETSFRLVGEGTGKSLDLDNYDRYYQQLFIWNKISQEVVGGYRLGLTDEIIRDRGLNGLYCHSLFKMQPAFFKNGPGAIELGRSFVRPEYQRSFSPLMLLWKGITRFVYKHPQYPVLFGPVSISNDYSSVSKDLMITYLKKHFNNSELCKLIKPRTPYRKLKQQQLSLSLMHNISIDDLSTLIASLEPDEKGLPILIKQYLKMSGEFLGFNRDADFGNCIDGFIRVDLRNSDKKLLDKYMGKDEASEFQSVTNSDKPHQQCGRKVL